MYKYKGSGKTELFFIGQIYPGAKFYRINFSLLQYKDQRLVYQPRFFYAFERPTMGTS